MPRYFFDVQDGQRSTHDTEGLLFAGLDEARAEAVKALPDMARDALQHGAEHVLIASVRAENGCVLFRATLTLSCEWLDGTRSAPGQDADMLDRTPPAP